MKVLPFPVLRTSHGLFAMRPSSRSGFSKSELECVPLAELPPKLRRSFRELETAWETLAPGRRDARTLQALLTVLRKSSGLPVLAPAPLPRLHSPCNLQPWLNDPEAVRQLLLQFRSCWMDHEPGAPLPPPEEDLVADPYAHARYGVLEDLRISARTPIYVDLLLQLLPASTPAEKALLARRLLSDFSPALNEAGAAALCTMLRAGTSWLELRHRFFRHDGPVFLSVGQEHGLFSRPAPSGLPSLLTYCQHHRPGVLWTELAPLLAAGWTPAVLTGMLRLQSKYKEMTWPPTTPPVAMHYRSIDRICHATGCARHPSPRHRELPSLLFHAAHHQPGLSEVLDGTRLSHWTPHQLRRLVRMLGQITKLRVNHPDWIRTRWTQLRPHLLNIIRTMESLHTNYRSKALGLFYEFFAAVGHGVTSKLVAKTPEILRTFCTAPFSTRVHACRALSIILRNTPASVHTVVAGNSRLVKRLEKMTRTCSRAHWIEIGGTTLEDIPEKLYLGILRQHPERFVQILMVLGALPDHSVGELWQMYREHPLMTCPLAEMGDREAIILLDAVAAAGEAPVPHKLRDHLAGNTTLAAHVLDHYRKEMHTKAVAMQARILLDLAHCSLQRCFPALRRSKDILIHSLVVARCMDDRRRTVNRALRHIALHRETTVIHDHANEKWLKSLPNRVLSRWQEGFAAERRLDKEGVVNISPEPDLQEQLKLGSYGGSCLAPGGVCDYSAAAVALDANKQVLYARDAEGKVVARQLVALSDDGYLVCFRIYPTTHSQQMREFFETYDHSLAQYLGVPLHRRGEYEIAELHGLQWFDDGALQLTT